MSEFEDLEGVIEMTKLLVAESRGRRLTPLERRRLAQLAEIVADLGSVLARETGQLWPDQAAKGARIQ